MFAWLLRTELPGVGLNMTIPLTTPLTTIPERFRLTDGRNRHGLAGSAGRRPAC